MTPRGSPAWRGWRPMRLRTRIAISFIALLALWTALSMATLEYLLSRTAYRFVRERGVETTRALTVECVPLVYYEDFTGLAELLAKQMRSVPDIRYVLVLGESGNLIWSTFRAGVPSDLLKVHHPQAALGEVTSVLIRFGDELVYDYQARERGVRVRLGLSLVPARRLIEQTFGMVLRWGALLGLAAVFGIAFYISRPVEQLSRSVEAAVTLERKLDGTAATGAILAAETAETTLIADRFTELLARLEERTRQLDASKKLAYVGEVATSIAHEINNPLSIIVMNAGFLAKRARRGELPPGAVAEVERLAQAAERSTLAVQKMLDFARYSTGRLPSAKVETDLRRLLEDTISLLRDRLEAAQCTVAVHLPDDLGPVVCDEQGLHQVLFNLLANAIDASPPGSEIKVALAANESSLSIEVTDQGAGMDAQVLARAREPFFTTKEPGKGTGLGLSISESIVQRHGGTMQIESAPARGTRVRIVLPREGRGHAHGTHHLAG